MYSQINQLLNKCKKLSHELNEYMCMIKNMIKRVNKVKIKSNPVYVKLHVIM